ncbi:unnamed protein product [Darwinula stevensoni]|uniref:t-SNARE coiled-coil homology domain-containing protein n=1 Tax=Darwinula stevensoni TaxID=69355 RepID=A0A7R9FQL9_9CRUS|nr:unnamed protein product [Darwinula stevensoni]CAG0899764.1 unnamed protein product [Darwinula stevensoni]
MSMTEWSNGRLLQAQSEEDASPDVDVDVDDPLNGFMGGFFAQSFKGVRCSEKSSKVSKPVHEEESLTARQCRDEASGFPRGLGARLMGLRLEQTEEHSPDLYPLHVEHSGSVLGANRERSGSVLGRARVEEIREMIEKMHANVESVKVKHSAILSAPTTDDRLKQELEDLTDEIKKAVSKVRAKLKAMEQKLEKKRAKSTPAATRIRETQLAALTREYVHAVEAFHRAQTDYRERWRRRIQRQIEFAGKSLSSKKVEEIVDAGNEIMFIHGIVIDEELMTLAEMESRHADVVKLEASIKEIHDLFADMADLVERQFLAAVAVSSEAGNVGACHSKLEIGLAATWEFIVPTNSCQSQMRSVDRSSGFQVTSGEIFWIHHRIGCELGVSARLMTMGSGLLSVHSPKIVRDWT